MGQRRELRDELRETFVSELEERLASMNDTLLALERPAAPHARRRLVDSLLRDAHTLKGGAQLVEWEAAAALTHALESHLVALRDVDAPGDLPLGSVFAAVDALGRIHAGDEPSPEELDALSDRLKGRSATEPKGEQEILGLHSVADSEAELTADGDGMSPEGGTPRPLDGRGSIRIPTERLDRLLARAGDLLTARDASGHQRRRMRALANDIGTWNDEWALARVAARQATRSDDTSTRGLRGLLEGVDRTAERADQLARDARALAGEAHVADQRFGQLVDQLEAELHDLRMVPASSLFRQFPRMARDLAKELGKSVELEALGWDTPIDRDLLERLREPMLHILRNAVDHGIELPDERERRGKPKAGRIVVEAGIRAGSIIIEVRDDGAGVDRERVVERAAAAGLAEAGDDQDPLRLLFAPGLSTSPAASRVSGRGVGLDAVATTVAAARGSVHVTTEPGLGTTFTLHLPLSLVSTRVLVVVVGGERYAIPIASIDRVVQVPPGDVVILGGRSCLTGADGSIVLAELGAAVGAAREGTGDSRLAVILAGPDERVGLFVDEVISEREVVVKELGELLGRVSLLQGAAVVERDEVLPLLDPPALAAWARGDAAVGLMPVTSREGPRDAERALRVLVVDDSLTTRTLEKNILAAAGFDVALAADGQEALGLLGRETFDLVISDVDMPGIDGIALTERIRGEERLRDLPVILVTAKEQPEDRQRGLRAGADVYLPKSQFDHQALLATIREVVG